MTIDDALGDNRETKHTMLTDHKVNGVNEAITITPDDRDPKNGNASHCYTMTWSAADGDASNELRFQCGPPAEVGVNGITNEALLAIVIDRLRGFQSGEFSCRENAIALTKTEEALHWLHSRTRARVQRGVEGKSIP